jgi:hypothetical protein
MASQEAWVRLMDERVTRGHPLGYKRRPAA